MQQTLDALPLELKQNKEASAAHQRPVASGQEANNDTARELLWDELNQAEKDAHIAKIQKSMIYTGSSSHSEQETTDTYGTVQTDAYYEMSDVAV